MFGRSHFIKKKKALIFFYNDDNICLLVETDHRDKHTNHSFSLLYIPQKIIIPNMTGFNFEVSGTFYNLGLPVAKSTDSA